MRIVAAFGWNDFPWKNIFQGRILAHGKLFAMGKDSLTSTIRSMQE